MQASIVGQQTGPSEITVGSPLTVGNGWNLLAIHEFGADVIAEEQRLAHVPLSARFRPPNPVGHAKKKSPSPVAPPLLSIGTVTN